MNGSRLESGTSGCSSVSSAVMTGHVRAKQPAPTLVPADRASEVSCSDASGESLKPGEPHYSGG